MDPATKPSRNPDIGKPANAQALKPARPFGEGVAPTSKTKIAGADLVPPADVRRPGIERRYKYWVGVTPSCPVEHIDCAGINFPKRNEELLSERGSSEKKRNEVIGSIVELNEEKIIRLRERLPRLVVRFLNDPGEKEEPGTGQNLGDLYRQPRKGVIVKIPRAEDVAANKAKGWPTHEYVAQANDEPAARYMFAVLCDDQQRGRRGTTYPETLETTGLEWPDEIVEPRATEPTPAPVK